MKKYIIICFVQIFVNSVNCQNATPLLLKDKYQAGSTTSKIEILNNKDTIFISQFHYQSANTNNPETIEKKYKGTPLYRNAWFENSTLYLDGKANKGNIAYNILLSELQFSPANMSPAIIVKPDSFEINNVKFVQFGNKIKLTKSHYYAPIAKIAKAGLYKQYGCTYRPKYSGQRTGYEVSVDDYEGEYIKNIFYFIFVKNKLVELKANNSDYKKFGNKKAQFEAYAKSQNLSPKIEKDLDYIAKYYLSIL